MRLQNELKSAEWGRPNIGLEPTRPLSCAILSPRRAAQTEPLGPQSDLRYNHG